MGKRKFFAYDTDRTGNMDEVRTLSEVSWNDLADKPFYEGSVEHVLTLTKKDFKVFDDNGPMGDDLVNWPKDPEDAGIAIYHWYRGNYPVVPATIISDWLTGIDKLAWKLTIRDGDEVLVSIDNSTAAHYVQSYETADKYLFWTSGQIGTPGGFDADWDVGFWVGKPSEGHNYAVVMLYQAMLEGDFDLTFEIFKVTPAKTLAPEVTGFTRVIFSDYNRSDGTVKSSMTAKEIVAAACKGPVYGYVGDPDLAPEECMIMPYMGSENVPITAYFGMPNYEMLILGNDPGSGWCICVIDGEERAKLVSRIPA